MQRLLIDLEHCYGIKKLSTQLDFSDCRVFAVYAPNGVMKSSFAQTFKDIAAGDDSRDRVFPQRATKRRIVDDSGTPLSSADVLVLPPYDEVFGDSEKTATLLVDTKLRKEYEQLYVEVDRAKDRFLKAMKDQSRSKRDLSAEISRTFTKSDNDFYKALIRVKNEVENLIEPQFADVPYDLVSDEKVAAFLSSHEVAHVLKDYIDKYNELLAQSKYFRKGTFDYYNAATIAKALTTHGFFKASHSVTLNAGADTKVEVRTEKELSEVISKEKSAILKDAQLRTAFNEMEKRITKNEMLRDFQEFLAAHEEVLALMGNLEKLKEDIWKSYFKAHEELYNDVIQKYQGAAARTKEIEAEAARQRTQWENVIDIFNRRFFVPFKLEVTNKVSVMLGNAPAPSLGFVFQEGAEAADIERPELLEVLSTGEKKALYILNVIFEVEVRRQAQAKTVFVVDDIADSFDYKNKYAIIQYLKEIADDVCFRQILLTHNFDFFRTVNSRFVRYSHCLMAQRSATGVELVPAVGIRNVFVNDWKLHFFDDPRKRVAAVSFVRNIIEYTRGEADPAYVKLTGLLHWKDSTAQITHADLDGIYHAVFSGTESKWTSPKGLVLDTIRKEAAACLKAPEGTNFENKIVLAIAIRLEAERHMVEKIADSAFLSTLTANQTSELLRRYKGLTGIAPTILEVLDEVALMTPENIHLNSFMYEPIIDMSDEHLRALYKKVKALA
jgi:hypothetical protein